MSHVIKETSHRIVTIGKIINPSLRIADRGHTWRILECRTKMILHTKNKFKKKWKMSRNHCSLLLRECLSHPSLHLFWTIIKADSNNFFLNKVRWNFSHRKDLPSVIEGKAIMVNFFKPKVHREILVILTLEDRYLVLRELFQLNFLTRTQIKRWVKYT